MIVTYGVGVFLGLSGLVFLIASIASGAAPLAFLRERLELTGGFERGAALVSGVLFLLSGGMVSLGFEHLR